jgi:hypothetical protein
LWKRPTNKPIASLRLSSQFNQVIQLDLLFIEQMIVLHVIDECIRWSAGMAIASKKPADILSGLIFVWFRIFGPPGLVIADKEGALLSEEASICFERWGTTYRPKPVGSHATMVERHHEIVRQTFHKVNRKLYQKVLFLMTLIYLQKPFMQRMLYLSFTDKRHTKHCLVDPLMP